MQGTWAHVHLWLGDERCVPADHEDANQRMVDESLLPRLRPHEGPHLHPVRGELGPEDAAWLYGSEHRAGDGRAAGVRPRAARHGPDGHTASLFPGHPAARAAHAPVIGVRDSPKPPPERITLTLPVLARARFTLLLATGEEKREALAGVRAGDELPPRGWATGWTRSSATRRRASVGGAPRGPRRVVSPWREGTKRRDARLLDVRADVGASSSRTRAAGTRRRERLAPHAAERTTDDVSQATPTTSNERLPRAEAREAARSPQC